MNNKYENAIGFIIGNTMQLINKMLNTLLIENSIPVTINQVVFLFMLKYKKTPEVIQQDMADWMNKDKSAILRMTDSLEKKEMVKRMGVPGDRRKNIIEITKKGESVLIDFFKIESKITNKLKRNISKEDYATMVKVMFQIQKNASE